MKFAYADPPYMGQAKRLYGCAEVDHPALIARLIAEFPDGWALSCGSKDLRFLLPLCPQTVRVAAWCKTWTSLVLPVKYAWEPVIFCGGRPGSFGNVRCRDWMACAPAMNTGKSPENAPRKRRTRNGKEKNFPGAKPADFCFWLFRLLGAEPGDTLADLFPGTGAVTKAWETFTRQGVMWEEAR